MQKTKWIVYGVGVFVSIIYGLSCHGFVRYLENTDPKWKDFYFVMSFGFVFIFPAILGSATIYFSDKEKRKSLLFQIFMPWVTATISLFISLIVGWEGTICLILALPIYLAMGSLGGVFTGWFLKITENQKRLQFISFSFFLLSPFFSGITENYFSLPTEIRTVNTRILIHAKPEIIWSKIARIPKITEPQNGFFYFMGFPRPVEATLSHEGVGGIREAIFEKGLMFLETITVWEPNKRLRFTIRSNPELTPLTTLDSHVVVGGRYFDTLVGEYKIEPIDESSSILHLYSQYRLSTRFNFYASIWSDFLMEDIQNNILRVLKLRCESNLK